jgi:hypothetical protein
MASPSSFVLAANQCVARSSRASCAESSRSTRLKIEVDDIVLCKVKGHEYLHLLKAIHGPRFLIGNNRGGTNGWITSNAIFGRCTWVED